ncbi:hypothetical protein ACIRPH_19200 [Nocardiopsis sp. NPDC101807]|uniref:hypothetical protein n=1 Tax=Nocardiopsis sp. NPDC101807 TaxID=3364339 RepID=UPI0037FF0B63
MFTTARTTAKTLLVAAGAAGFVALGAGIAGADTLGGVTDGLQLGDLGSRVPAQLTEGVSTPLGDLVKVQPGKISAQPDVQQQSAPRDVVGHVVGDNVSAPLEGDEKNSANVGPLDLGAATGSLPLSQGSDPVSDLVGGLGVLEGLGLGGGTLPMGHGASTLPVRGPAETVGAAVSEVGATAEQGVHEVGNGLNGLDAPLPGRGATLPMAAADSPTGPFSGENTDLTGGKADLIADLVLSDDVVLPLAGTEATGGAAETLPVDLAGTADLAASTLPQTALSAGDVGLPELPAPGEVLPLAAPETTDAVTGLVREDALGNDLVGVRGLPRLGQPTLDTGQVTGLLPSGAA